MHKADIHLEAEIGGPAARVIFLVSTEHGHTFLPAISWSTHGLRSELPGTQANAIEAWAKDKGYEVGPWLPYDHGKMRAVLTPRDE